jgi:hypothetical protein
MPFHRMLVAVVGTALLACPVGAGEPKAADLSGLREAVATADKRGENVCAIREALTAFEKALAKGTLKAGASVPELVALRAAVELTAKKGENVEAVSKELGLIEKALTGREYERPKPPEPKPEPVSPVRPFPPRPGGGAGIVIGPVNGFNARSITISGGNYTIKARQGDVSYEITGQLGAAEDPKIVIRDGDKKAIEVEDLKKVPEDYRPAVERLLKSISRP